MAHALTTEITDYDKNIVLLVSSFSIVQKRRLDRKFGWSSWRSPLCRNLYYVT